MIKVFETEVSAPFLPKSLFAIAASFAAWQKVENLNGYYISHDTVAPYAGDMSHDQKATFLAFNNMFQLAFSRERQYYNRTKGEDLEVLSDLLNQWYDNNNLERMCAFEMLYEDGLSTLTNVTLQWFNFIWDYSEMREEA